MFKWLSSLLRRDGIINNTDYTLNQLFGAVPSASGVPVNYHTCWNVAPFYRGVDLIASKLGTINCAVLLSKAGHKEPLTSHPAHSLLRKNAAPWLTSFAWKQLAVKDALWAGNHYSIILRDGATPTQLIPLDPRTVTPYITRDMNTLEVTNIYYHVTYQGTERNVPFEDMFHLKGLGETSGFWGMPILEYCKDVLGLCSATVRYGSAYFRNNSTPGLIVEVPGWIKDRQQKEDFIRSINKQPGPDEAFRLMLLQNGAKATIPSAVSNEAAQFLGSMEQAAIICSQLLGLPASKLGARSVNSSYGSLEQEELSIYKDCYNKWMVALETEASMKLLSEAEIASGDLSIEFDRLQLLEGDPEAKLKSIQAEVDGGLLSLNEARQLLNLEKVDNENADKHRQPSNFVFMEDVKATPEPAPLPPPGQPPADQADQPASTDQQRAIALTELTVTRLLTRLRKASGKFKAEDHREVMVEALSPFQRAEVWIDSLLAELAEVLPEQIPGVLDTIDPKKISEGLWQR